MSEEIGEKNERGTTTSKRGGQNSSTKLKWNYEISQGMDTKLNG